MDKQTRILIKFVRDMQGGTDKYKRNDKLGRQYREEELLKRKDITIRR